MSAARTRTREQAETDLRIKRINSELKRQHLKLVTLRRRYFRYVVVDTRTQKVAVPNVTLDAVERELGWAVTS